MLSVFADGSTVEVLAELEGLGELVPEMKQAVLDALGERGKEINKANVQSDIYDQPPSPNYDRTGALISAQNVTIPDPDSRLITTDNSAIAASGIGGEALNKDPETYGIFQPGMHKAREDTEEQLQREAPEIAGLVVAEFIEKELAGR